ncbi:ArnT family glycosyltransferase [Dyella psychrodurans]|uniref:ArnT family glycosyltransferase n=1 Tax=Dyella psychrodurans TaxID=1927960 RepID=UPI0013146E79|nr:glycosyltransferase family 39 protein [Dyella psychrodurans]
MRQNRFDSLRKLGNAKAPTVRMTALVAFLSVTAFILRFHFTGIAYNHSDEPIAVGVVSGLLQRHTVDTNWAHFDLPAKFHYAQFNFSSYYLALAFFCELARDHSIKSMRLLSALLGALCVPLSFLLGKRLHSARTGFFAALMTAFSPQLFFDSLFARPDSFFALIYLIAILVAISSPRNGTRIFISSLLFGILAACKISALFVAPIPLLLFLVNREASDRYWRMLALSAAGVIAGFAAGAPYALLNPVDFVNGVLFLMGRYASGGGPLGLGDAPLYERLWYLAKFIIASIGPIAVLTSLYAYRRLSKEVLVIGSLSIISVLYLGSRGWFYERNFDHCLPVIYILAWIGISQLTELFSSAHRGVIFATLSTLALVPTAYFSYQLQYQILSGRYEKRVESYLARQSAAGANALVWPSIVYGDPLNAIRTYMKDKPLPMTVSFAWSDDQHAAKNISEFLNGYHAIKVDEIHDPFWLMPPCSIQAYVSMSYVTYRLSARR